MAFVHTPGLRIHYHQAGSGPQPLIALHGNFASWRWWKASLDRLSPEFRAYVPDLRGCGRTTGDFSADAYSIPQLALDLGAFADALGERAFHLVGHSLGGAVALQFALSHPERVLSLTLVAPAPATGLLALREGNTTSARILRKVDPGHNASMAVLRSGYGLHRAIGTHRMLLRRAFSRLMPSARVDPADLELLIRDAALMPARSVVGFLQALHRWNVAGELSRLTVPTLVVAGGRDELVPVAALEETARLIPSARLVIWPGVGHSPQLERPDAFVRLLVQWAEEARATRWRRWLRRLRAPSGAITADREPGVAPAAAGVDPA